jgi:phospholipid/cholesterol/gamma-HCH transport system permease protein
MQKLADYFGKKLRNYIQDLLYFSGFLKITLVEIFNFFSLRRKVSFLVLFRQILFTGFEALNLINLIGLAIGATIILEGMGLLDNFGQSDLVYKILIIIITTELGPLLTAFIIIARSGTSISTELGNMVVNHEVEALTAIGIHPISYLVVPRILGVVISLFCLSIYFNIAGLLGGYLVSNFVQPLSFSDFFSNLLQRLTFRDILVGQIKSLVFGFIIAIISCYHGLSVKYATTEVPWRTIKAVVSSLTWIFIFSIIITVISYSI